MRTKPATAVEFLESLKESGLAQDDKLSVLRHQVSEQVSDAREFAAELVHRNILTAYQAEHLLEGRVGGFFLGKYKILEPIGQGGMGKVLRAEDTTLRRQVALKILSHYATQDERVVARFQREARLAAQLQHENIVRVYEVGDERRCHFIAMEFVSGRELRQIIGSRGRLSVKDSAAIIRQIADGLEYARQHGIIHRDIKPSNILVDGDGHAKLLDLGIARFVDPDTSVAASFVLTQTGEVMGTVDYMAPEQAEDTRLADTRSDIYALGCTLYECLTGRPPFPSGTTEEKLTMHREQQPTPIADLVDDVPPAVIAIVSRMMEKQPKDRYQTPANVVHALQDLRFDDTEIWPNNGAGSDEGATADNVKMKRLGDFEIIREIGRGGMGIVYAARQVTLNRQVALKLLPTGLGLTRNAAARFHREAQAAAKLHHTNIVAIYSEGEHEGTCYFAMEMIDGRALDKIIATFRGEQPLEPDALNSFSDEDASDSKRHSDSVNLSSSSNQKHFDMIARWIADAADALHFAHRQGVIHRDVKPSNLMVDSEGRIKLMDFGLARMLEQPGMTVSGEFLGTPRYMSPEQIAAGRIPVDHRTDIYSLGVTLYELLTLQPPFSGKHRDEVISAIMHKVPRRPRRIRKKIPVDLETICLKAIERDPDRRYQTAEDMAEDMRRYVNRFAIKARRVGPAGHAFRFVRRHKLLSSATALLILVSAISGVLWWKYVIEQGKVQSERQHREKLQRERDAVALAAQAEKFYFTAQKLEAEGNYAKSLEAIDEILQMVPDHSGAKLLRARLLFNQSRPNEAISLLEDYLSTQPDDANAGAAHILLAAIYHGLDPGKAREHQRLSESLMPNTADTFHLQAMMSSMLEERQQWLDQALQLDPSHFPSIQASIHTAFQRKDFHAMRVFADRGLTVRKHDAALWSLLAVALRELGEFADAMQKHNRAIKLAPLDPQAYDLRRDTFQRRGGNEYLHKALIDARRCIELDPDEPMFRFHAFWLAMQLGWREEASQEAAKITTLVDSFDRHRFHHWLRKWVFDVVEKGQNISMPDTYAPGSPFAVMQEAIDQHSSLIEAGATRVVATGRRATWSDDGKKIAYGAGASRSRALEILDLKTKESKLLAIPGRKPMWSPDGKWIAFERSGGDEHDDSSAIEPDIWMIQPDGANLQRIATGYSVSWGRSSEQIYFHNLQDGFLYSLQLGQDSNPQPIMFSPGKNPIVSPNGKMFASAVGGRLWICDLKSKKLIRDWNTAIPLSQVAWSPDSSNLCLTSGRSGMWILDIEEEDARQVIDGPILRGFWSPDGSQIAFGVATGSTYHNVPTEIWVAQIHSEQTTLLKTTKQYLEDQMNQINQQWESSEPTAELHLQLAKSHATNGNKKDAYDVVSEALQRWPENTGLYWWRGEQYARDGKWEHVADDFQNAAKLADSADWAACQNFRRAAIAMVALEKRDAYQEHCKSMLRYFSDTTTPALAEMTARACLFMPPVDKVNLEKAIELASRAVRIDPDNWAVPWAYTTFGLAEYRRGNYEAANDWCEETLRRRIGRANQHIQARLIKAMALAKLDQPIEARENFMKAANNLEVHLAFEGCTGMEWPDRIICQTLRDEAEQLISPGE